MEACRIQAMLTWYQSCLLYTLMEWMPIQSRHSFIINSVVLDKSIKFHYCCRKLNMQVLPHEREILSNLLLASVQVL